MRNRKGYGAGYNDQAVVIAQQVIVGAMLSQHLAGRTCSYRCLSVPETIGRGGDPAEAAHVLANAGYVSEEKPATPTKTNCGCSRRWPKTPAGPARARAEYAWAREQLAST